MGSQSQTENDVMKNTCSKNQTCSVKPLSMQLSSISNLNIATRLTSLCSENTTSSIITIKEKHPRYVVSDKTKARDIEILDFECWNMFARLYNAGPKLEVIRSIDSLEKILSKHQSTNISKSMNGFKSEVQISEEDLYNSYNFEIHSKRLNLLMLPLRCNYTKSKLDRLNLEFINYGKIKIKKNVITQDKPDRTGVRNDSIINIKENMRYLSQDFTTNRTGKDDIENLKTASADFTIQKTTVANLKSKIFNMFYKEKSEVSIPNGYINVWLINQNVSITDIKMELKKSEDLVQDFTKSEDLLPIPHQLKFLDDDYYISEMEDNSILLIETSFKDVMPYFDSGVERVYVKQLFICANCGFEADYDSAKSVVLKNKVIKENYYLFHNSIEEYPDCSRLDSRLESDCHTNYKPSPRKHNSVISVKLKTKSKKKTYNSTAFVSNNLGLQPDTSINNKESIIKEPNSRLSMSIDKIDTFHDYGLQYICSCGLSFCCMKCLKTSNYHLVNCKELSFDVPEYIKTSKSLQGIVGMRNFGNTCYLNTSIQMLSVCWELTNYFLQKYYNNDLNTTNPIGFQGNLAVKYYSVINTLWYGVANHMTPWGFHLTVANYNSFVIYIIY